MEPIFKEQANQLFFEQNGFVKVSLLPDEKVDTLLHFFQENKQRHATVSALHHTTTDTGDTSLIQSVDEKIKSVFLPELEKIMINFKPLAATFHIKEPGTGSATGIHQDPTFVDETRYYSANVWVALHDIGDANGNLFFVSGSHNAVESLRSIPFFPSYYESFKDELPKLVTTVPLKKGEAVIFSNATIHGATENLTNTTRLAATLLVCSKPAEWLFYYNDQETIGKLDKYWLDSEAFVSMSKGEKPDQRVFAENIAYAFPQISYNDFLHKTGRRVQTKKNYINRLKGIFRKTNPA